MARPNTKQNKPSSSKQKHLVIVESPAKATTVGRYLGDSYTVKASMGHVRDLPDTKLGVDLERDFEPQYTVMKGKSRVVAELKRAAEGVTSIYLATDPDREGEAISWHLLEAAKWKGIPVRRVVFHQITPDSVKEAFQNDREIDMRLVNAQQARRILDRLVGYQLSPLLWRKVQRGLSAGRVQSVALRMVVERDQSIEKFTPVEYWSIKTLLTHFPRAEGSGRQFTAELYSIHGDKKRIELPDQNTVESIIGKLSDAAYSVSSVTRREIRRRPSPPFITSTLQQEAWRQLRFSARRTMTLAQNLYEGLDVGDEGATGLITYMRTDSPDVAPTAITETRNYIETRWDKKYLPDSPRRYRSKSKVAQEAHEAIRPTAVNRDPESLKSNLSHDQYRLYELIWKRMVASQMADAIFDATQIDIKAETQDKPDYTFRARGSVVKSPGFRALYTEGVDEEESDDSDDENQVRMLPPVQEGNRLQFDNHKPEQHFTKPPPRYTEASLIKALEERGIGRPSTYAPIVGTLVDREYATRERGSLNSTRLGQVVSESLISHFPNIMDLDFTAQLEEQLDDVANGRREWVPLLHEFYAPFSEALGKAHEDMPRVRIEEPTEETCEKCSRQMVIKRGKFGPFLSCSGFPECRNSKPIVQNTGAKCPQCSGDIVQRQSRGRTFFGCSNYPNCNFTVSRRPLPQPCPECDGLLVGYRRGQARCTNCAYVANIDELDAETSDSTEPAGAF